MRREPAVSVMWQLGMCKKRENNRHYSFMLIPQHQVKEKIYTINLLGLIYLLSAYGLCCYSMSPLQILVWWITKNRKNEIKWPSPSPLPWGSQSKKHKWKLQWWRLCYLEILMMMSSVFFSFFVKAKAFTKCNRELESRGCFGRGTSQPALLLLWFFRF